MIKFNLLPLTFAICLMVGCTNEPEKQPEFVEKGFQIITIDSCQYLYKWDGYHAGTTLTHKGNCNNPIHKK